MWVRDFEYDFDIGIIYSQYCQSICHAKHFRYNIQILSWTSMEKNTVLWVKTVI
jgi:hypothetical protein